MDGIPFHPYYTVKDIMGVAVFLIVFSAIVFFSPEMGGYFLESNNFIPADPLKTPAHIAPVWYFTPFYAMLRAVPSVLQHRSVRGVIVMGAAVMIFFALPWLDRGRVKSIRYRGPIYRAFFAVFVVSFLILGYLGVEPTNVWGEFAEGLPARRRRLHRDLGGARADGRLLRSSSCSCPGTPRSDKEKPVPQRVT